MKSRIRFIQSKWPIIGILLAFIILVSCMVNVEASTMSNKKINDIIDSRYQMMKESEFFKKIQQQNNLQKSTTTMETDSKSTPHLSYQCQHDKMNQKIRDIEKKMMAKEEELKSQGKSLDGLYSSKLLNENVNKATARQPIRISNITLMASDKYECTTVGQKVMAGDYQSASTTACSDTNDASSCLYTCRDVDVLTSDIQTYINNFIVPAIKDTFQALILVDQVNPLVLDKNAYKEFNGECDYGITIDPALTTTGMANTDFIIYVTARPATSTGTIAYAKPCNFAILGENRYGKPLAATINFNPIYFNQKSITSQLMFHEYVRVGIHEMTHALGFSSFLYNSFTKDGQFYNAGATFTETGKTPSGQKYSKDRAAITSPNVVAFAQDHYACSSIDEVELEDNGGSGTAGSHWEKRQAGEEYMIGYVNPIMPITNLTLSLLKDTGWYDIDYTTSEQLIWGSKMGCDWYDQCTPESWNYQGYFCSVGGAKGCTSTRMGKGVCALFQYTSNLEPAYQHFKQKNLGGDFIADACPHYSVDDTSANTGTTSYCSDDSKTGDASVFEVYSLDSRCFEYSASAGVVGQACWQQKCGANNTVMIKINQDWINCPNGQNVTSNGVTVICPLGFVECGATPSRITISAALQLIPSFTLAIFALMSTIYFLY